MKLTFVLFIVLLGPTAAWGCTCIRSQGLSDQQYLKQLRSVDAIFEGEVVTVGERREETRKYGKHEIAYGYRPVVFKVLNAWKGIDSERVNVEAEAWSSCSIPAPRIGSKIMVYLYRNKSKVLEMHYCSINGYDNERTRRLIGLGEKILPK